MGTGDVDEAGEGVQVAIFIGLSALMILIFQKRFNCLFLLFMFTCVLYTFLVFSHRFYNSIGDYA